MVAAPFKKETKNQKGKRNQSKSIIPITCKHCCVSKKRNGPTQVASKKRLKANL